MKSPAAPTSPRPVAAQFALILDGLLKAIAARVVEYPWTGAMVLYVWTRVATTKQRFERLAAMIVAGRLPRERFTWPRPPRAPAPVPPPDAPVAPRKPRVWKLFSQHRFAWLCGAMACRPYLPGAGEFASQLRHLLDDPEMRALLAATPRMRKLLRPLFWMLGIEAARPRAPRARAKRPRETPAERAAARTEVPRCWRRPPVPRPRGNFSRAFTAARALLTIPPRPDPAPLGSFATLSPSAAPPLGSFSSVARSAPPPLGSFSSRG